MLLHHSPKSLKIQGAVRLSRKGKAMKRKYIDDQFTEAAEFDPGRLILLTVFTAAGSGEMGFVAFKFMSLGSGIPLALAVIYGLLALLCGTILCGCLGG